jgi:hypothetical protein
MVKVVAVAATNDHIAATVVRTLEMPGKYFVCEVDDLDRAHVIAGPLAKSKAESMCRAYDAEPDGPTTFAIDAAGLMVLQAAEGDITAIFGPKKS